MVHGMWSSPAVWTDKGFMQSLEDKGFKNIKLPNYSMASHLTFDPKNNESKEGRDAIYLSILQALKEYADDTIAVSQVDVVAHSLGGLYTRSFAQSPANLDKRNFKQGYIHKLITIGTPHMGTPLGPILYNYKTAVWRTPTGIFTSNILNSILKDHPVGSVHRDFRPNSQAYKNLLNTNDPSVNIKKAHAIVGLANYGEKTIGWESFISYIARVSINDILGTAFHDLIVPASSQRGGLDFSPQYSAFLNTAHAEVPFLSPRFSNTTETSNSDIFEKVSQLLLSDNSSDFADGFPAPSQIAGMVSTQQANSGQPIYLPIAVTTDSAQIKLTPSSKNIVINSDADSVTITFDTLNGAIISNPICIIEDLGLFPFPDNGPYEITIPISALEKAGRLNFCVLARNISEALLGDTSSIYIQPMGEFIRFEADPAFMDLDSLVREVPLSVYAFYKQDDKEVSYLIDSTSGLHTAIKSNNAELINNHIVRGVKGGLDSVLLTYNGQELIVPITISEGFDSLIKYPCTINWDIPDMHSLDLPFIITAESSSGEQVEYSIESGPITYKNGIFYINGPGTAKIKAFSPGNAYFDSVSSVRTFNIIASSPIKYTFIGNGNWDIPSNWSNNLLPPTTLPSGSEIVIDPAGDGECILNVQQKIFPGGKFTVVPGKKISITGNLDIQY